jgi:hypothetical protein
MQTDKINRHIPLTILNPLDLDLLESYNHKKDAKKPGVLPFSLPRQVDLLYLPWNPTAHTIGWGSS